jgi:hypothetical protein
MSKSKRHPKHDATPPARLSSNVISNDALTAPTGGYSAQTRAGLAYAAKQMPGSTFRPIHTVTKEGKPTKTFYSAYDHDGHGPKGGSALWVRDNQGEAHRVIFEHGKPTNLLPM